MGRSVSIPDGYDICPHCGGSTDCDCATCGSEGPRSMNPMGRRVKGVCTVCKGLGCVPKLPKRS